MYYAPVLRAIYRLILSYYDITEHSKTCRRNGIRVIMNTKLIEKLTKGNKLPLYSIGTGRMIRRIDTQDTFHNLNVTVQGY